MGKTMTVENICKKLSQSSVCVAERPVTITVHKALDADDIIERLTEKLGNGFTKDSYCAIHIDIANAVSFFMQQKTVKLKLVCFRVIFKKF